jgi:hypothetical protein
MKPLFSLLFSVVSFSLSAQVLGPDVEKQIDESIRKRVEEDNARKMGPSHPLIKLEVPSRDEQIPTTRRRPGLYALPQDSMPCIVPDTERLAVMPNAAPMTYPYRKDMPTRSFKKHLPRAK